MNDLYDLTKEQLISRINELEVFTNGVASAKQYPDLFKALSSGTDEIIYQINNVGTIILSEGKGLEKLGLLPGQIVGQSVFDIYKEYPIVINSIKEAFKGIFDTYEVQINDHYFKNWFTPVKNEQGEITSIIGLSVDISEQKRLEIEYQYAERLLSSSIDYAAIGMCRVNLDGYFISANLKLCDMLGYSQSELKKMTFLDISHPEDKDIGLNAIESMISNNQNQVNFEKRYIHKDGNILEVLVNSVVIGDTDNSPLFFFTQIIDQTENKKAKKQLLLSHNKWQSTFDAMKNSVSIIDLEGKIIQCNKVTFDLFNINEENLKNLSCHQIVHDTDKPIPNCPVTRMKISKKTESMVFQDKNTWLQVNVDPIFDDNKTLVGAVHVISDISDLKNAEEQVYGFSKIFEESLNEIYIFNFEDLKFNQVNNSALNNLGYSFEEIKEMTPVDIKPDFTVSKFNEFIKPLIDGEVNKLEFETTHERKDKSRYNVEVNLQTLNFKDSKMFAAIIIDITHKKAARKALIESEEKFRKILQNTPLPLCYFDKNGSLDYINDRFTKVLGYDKSDIPDIDTWWLKAYPDEDYRKRAKNTWSNFVIEADNISENIKSEVYQIQCGDGSTRHMIISGITFGDEFLATFLDITERKNTEDELEKQMHRLQGILEGTNAGTWNWNIQTNEVTLNERWAEIIGYTLKELGPIDINTWSSSINPDDFIIAKKLLEKHFSEELDYFDVLYRQQHKNGNWVWVNSRGKVTEWNDLGKPMSMSGTHLDVSAQKLAEEKLKENQEHLETLIKSRTKELEEKNTELDNALKVFVGREQTIRDLQKKIRILKGGSQ